MHAPGTLPGLGMARLWPRHCAGERGVHKFLWCSAGAHCRRPMLSLPLSRIQARRGPCLDVQSTATEVMSSPLMMRIASRAGDAIPGHIIHNSSAVSQLEAE